MARDLGPGLHPLADLSPGDRWEVGPLTVTAEKIAAFAALTGDESARHQGEGAVAIQSYLDDENLELENVVLDPAHSLSRHYAAPGMPVTLFLGADGQVVTSHFGEISREALDVAIARLIPSDKE